MRKPSRVVLKNVPTYCKTQAWYCILSPQPDSLSQGLLAKIWGVQQTPAFSVWSWLAQQNSLSHLMNWMKLGEAWNGPQLASSRPGSIVLRMVAGVVSRWSRVARREERRSGVEGISSDLRGLLRTWGDERGEGIALFFFLFSLSKTVIYTRTWTLGRWIERGWKSVKE